MKNKLLLLSMILIIVVTITGCGVTNSKKSYTCVKDGENREMKGIKYTVDTEKTIKVDSNNKAIKYSVKATYTFNSVSECNTSIEKSKNYIEHRYGKKHPGHTIKYKDNCSEKYYTDTNSYVVKDLNNASKSDIQYLDNDDILDLDKWLDSNKNNGYKCGEK